MEKVRRNFTIDEEVDEYLSQPEINASGLVNALVRERMGDSDGND